MGKAIDLLQGTLDMLILKAVSLGPLHGYGVLLRIQPDLGEQLEIQQGSLYPALYRLEHQGWIASEWGESDNNRKAKFYSLTAAGRRQLHSETEKWNRMASLIANILRTTPEKEDMNLTRRFRSWLKSGWSRDSGSKVKWKRKCVSTLRAAQRIWFAKAFQSKKRCDRRGLSSAESSLTKMPCGHRWACAGGVN